MALFSSTAELSKLLNSLRTFSMPSCNWVGLDPASSREWVSKKWSLQLIKNYSTLIDVIQFVVPKIVQGVDHVLEAGQGLAQLFHAEVTRQVSTDIFTGWY